MAKLIKQAGLGLVIACSLLILLGDTPKSMTQKQTKGSSLHQPQTGIIKSTFSAQQTQTPQPIEPQVASQVGSPMPQWSNLAKKAKRLADDDELGLIELYSRARDVIRENEAALSEQLSTATESLVNTNLEESFFAVSSWIRYSSAPTRIIQALWTYRPPADSPTADTHHPGSTPATRYEHVQAYALKELRQQLERGKIGISDDERKNLVTSLIPKAAQEKSLNLSLEMFELLATLHETAAIQQALSQRSDRDRTLIQAVLAEN